MMITNPIGILTVLVVALGGIYWVSGFKKLEKFFDIFPPIIWCYFIPMILSTAGILPSDTPLYKSMKEVLLPAALVLLLLSTDLPGIVRLGFIALSMMFIGTFGIILGASVSTLIFKPWLPADAWMGIGALSGSWIGGSANMIAIKEALGTPANIFTPMVVVDTVVGYSWMGIMIALSVHQDKFDRWNHSTRGAIDDIAKRLLVAQTQGQKQARTADLSIMLALAFGLGFLSVELGRLLPDIKGIANYFTWAIVLATTFGLLLSYTKVSKLETVGASKFGYLMLYLMLASVGAQGDLKAVIQAPVFILLGIVWVMVHIGCLFIGARVLKAPMFFAATASMANIGGTVTSPIIAAIYQPGLAPVGLLLAVLGQIMGTYLGIVVAYIAKWILSL
ncbi:MAG: DUF819 family protein [Elusimicrobiota bacterium]